MYFVGSLARAVLGTCAFAAVGAPAAAANAWSGNALPYAAAPMCAFEAPVSMTAPGLAPKDSEAGFETGSLCPPPPRESVDEEQPIGPGEARRAYREALRLVDDGRPGEALLQLQLVEHAYPSLADRIALRQGELRLMAGDPEAACHAFERAAESLDGDVRAQARVGRVRCLIASGDRHAAQKLRALLRTFPDLPIELNLRFELARAQERAGHGRTAARIYRNIDLRAPARGVAKRARARLRALRREGIELWPLPAAKRVDRLERLAGAAPPAQVKDALDEFEDAKLSKELRSRVALVAAQVARVEGRWQDARKHLQRARWTGALPEDVDTEEVTAKARDMADAVTAHDTEHAEKQVRRLKGWRPYRRLPVARLLKILEVATPAGLTEVADGALEALDVKEAPAKHRFNGVMMALGAASPGTAATVLEGLVGHPKVGLAARYHYARTLERLGRWAEAELELLRVLGQDGSQLGYYRMWAELRLRKVRAQLVGHCGPEDLTMGMSGKASDPGLEEVKTACTTPLPEDAQNAEESLQVEAGPVDRAIAAPAIELPSDDPVDAETLAERLAPVAQRWGEAFPWLPRAHALLRLGDTDSAADELHETYLAWRRARGRPIRRAGLLSVFRGDNLPRKRVTWSERQERRALDSASRDILADVAADLGDTGVAVGFGGHERARLRPRAHRQLVQRAAERHGLDPNLLFAVMRVESVYQHRIISYAGAVGLMQIMPRTGKLIANQLGRHDFTTDDLLDPATNIEFAAWYLASLIERWDGRLPLAIASYNGGPHNVRRWTRDYARDIPLDAFLERIPFSQTHRYVRRVLTHYAAYRAQKELPMRQLATSLPDVGPDPIGF